MCDVCDTCVSEWRFVSDCIRGVHGSVPANSIDDVNNVCVYGCVDGCVDGTYGCVWRVSV